MENTMNTKQVRIDIKSTQHDIAEETLDTTYNGKYHCIDKKHIIHYEEYFEGEGTAPLKNTNLIKIDNDSVQIIKKGAINTQMQFITGQEYHGSYQTPFGCFNMTIYTEQVKIKANANALQADITYTLDLNQCPVSKYTICMKIT